MMMVLVWTAACVCVCVCTFLAEVCRHVGVGGRQDGVATVRAHARYRLKRLVFVGVPRAPSVDERAQRGLAGGARGAGAN